MDTEFGNFSDILQRNRLVRTSADEETREFNIYVEITKKIMFDQMLGISGQCVVDYGDLFYFYLYI